VADRRGQQKSRGEEAAVTSGLGVSAVLIELAEPDVVVLSSELVLRTLSPCAGSPKNDPSKHAEA